MAECVRLVYPEAVGHNLCHDIMGILALVVMDFDLFPSARRLGGLIELD